MDPPADHRLLRIEREARFEAARGVLLSRLEGGRRDDGWFRTPGLLGRLHKRDVEVRFPGGCDARWVRLALRIRTGDDFAARPRARLLQWLGMGYLALTGHPPEGVAFAAERLLRDFGALRVEAGSGLVRADLSWEAADPDPERLLKVLERLDRIALALEEVRQPLRESGGLLTCPYCRELIAEDAPLARCDACGTPYHPSCFEENGGCAVYGCRHQAARTSSGRIARQGPPPRRRAELKEPSAPAEG